MNTGKTEADWEITPGGLYIATRSFLSRRGYCCANKCRNCPYINWNETKEWQPLPAEQVKRTYVSPKALAGVSAKLQYHEQQLARSTSTQKQAMHQRRIEHYSLLLQRWSSR